MLLWDTYKERLITAVEGSGDNLTAEDEADGFKDYIMTQVYERDGDTLKLVDAGQMLTQTLVADLDEEEAISRLADYWESNEQYLTILEEGL